MKNASGKLKKGSELMKLGEALICEGLITKQQLNLALERQVVFGGRIGTNLLELRILSEEALTRFIGDYFRLPYISQEVIDSIPKNVLSSVSNEIIAKYKILPLRKEGKKLHLAMLNAGNLPEVDELSFMTGFHIIPYAISEMRLLFALDRYYEIKTDQRYIRFLDRFNPKLEVFDSLEKVKEAITEAINEEEIAEILIRLAKTVVLRVAIFNVRSDKITIWKAKGFSTDKFEIKVELPLFSEVIKSKIFYRGPVRNSPDNAPLINLLSGNPQDVLIKPIIIKGEVVGLFYFDNGNNSVLDRDVYYLSNLASLFSLAVEFLLLKKSILGFTFQIES
jgi:hypothetical protein